MKYKIAVVEDNELIANMIKINLERVEYTVRCFSCGEELLERRDHEFFDLVILDILLPGISGMKVLEQLRKNHFRAPVLVLTVETRVHSKINALDTGADDYLVKPFNMDELLARIRALIRRSHGERIIPANQIVQINNFKINLSTRQCESNLDEIVLSEKEINLLTYFLLHPRLTLNRADILEEVWGMDVSPTPRTVDNFVLKFRKLFETNPEKPIHFISVRNKGYRFEPK